MFARACVPAYVCMQAPHHISAFFCASNNGRTVFLFLMINTQTHGSAASVDEVVDYYASAANTVDEIYY